MDTNRAALKTALLAPSGPLFAWAIQTALNGNVATGVVGCAIGVAMVAGFVILEEKDIPYEDEIREIIGQVDTETAAKEAAREAGERITEATETSSGSEPDAETDTDVDDTTAP